MKLWIQLVALTCLLILANTQASAHNSAFSLNSDWKMIASVQASKAGFHPMMAKLSKMDIDIAGVDVQKSIIDVLISDADYEKLKQGGIEFYVREVKGITRGPDSEYQTPEEVEAYLREYNQRFPELTHLVSIGKSLEGRDIWALKISDNAKKREIEEPALLFNSMHHAREVMGPEVGLDIIEYLLENYHQDSQVQGWVDANEIWVMPMFNVDGNNKMWSEDSWWRKNVRGGYGVDLNRNYPSGWNSCNGSSGWRSSQTYRGESPASEPETQAMMAFIKNIRPVFDISYHSFSELVIYPFGCEPKRAMTKEVVEKVGNEIAGLIGYTAGTAWETLYNADGGDIDWMYEAYQVIPFVIELNGRSQGFHPDYAKWRDKTVVRNRPGWQHLLNRVGESGIRGIFTVDGNAVSGHGLSVFKVEGDKTTLFQNYVGHENGAFHLVLNPGKYELRFDGAGKKAVQRVNVGSDLIHLNVGI